MLLGLKVRSVAIIVDLGASYVSISKVQPLDLLFQCSAARHLQFRCVVPRCTALVAFRVEVMALEYEQSMDVMKLEPWLLMILESKEV